MKNNKLYTLVLAGMFLAIALLLPFLTGQNQKLGNILCLMHVPVLLCGYFCGGWYGLCVGATAPILRSLIFGMPVMFPHAVTMAVELAVYGLLTAVLYGILPKKKIYIYVSLVGAMLAGRIASGVCKVILMGLGKLDFGWTAFITGSFVTAWPGIVIQLVLIPVLVMSLEKYTRKTA